MGVNLEDCSTVAKLIAKKIFISEFVAYKALGTTINFRKEIIRNKSIELYRNQSLPIPHNILMIWNDRSMAISTYALCGFSNFAAIGICIGALSALAPSRSRVISRLAAKAMIGGNIACFLTACICGMQF
jgi:nucleoside permease NupC